MVLSHFTSLAPPPEKTTSLVHSGWVFGVFALFLLGLMSWGSWIREKLKVIPHSGSEAALFDLATGSVLAYLMSYALTAVSLFSSSKPYVAWALLAFGFALGTVTHYPRFFSDAFRSAKGWFPRLLLMIPVLLVIVKILEGLQFHQHGDAYVTYLPAPRSWAVLGNFNDYLRFIQYFLSTSWESLFAWGTVLMGLKGGAGLDSSQWFSQWCTGGIGVLGSLLAGFAFCKRWSEKYFLNQDWFPVVAVFAVQVPVLRWTANLAKHDMGVAFWGVSAFYFSNYFLPLSLPLAFVTGVITGTAVIGKLTVGILGICIGLGVLWNSRKSFLFFSLGGIVGVLPVFMRNFVTTGSPVFPWLPQLFKTPYLSESMMAGAEKATGTRFSVANLPLFSSEIVSNLPLLISLALMILFVSVQNRNDQKLRDENLKSFLKTISIPFLAMIGFTLVFRPSTEIRYQGPTLIILAAMTAFFSFYLIQNLAKQWGYRLNAVFAIILIATCNLTFFTFTQLGTSKYEPISKKLTEIQGTGGAAKLWIRQNLNPLDSLLAVGDSHPYYLMDYNMTDSSQSKEFDPLIFGKTVEEAEKLLLAAPFRYLYLATDASFSIYKKTIIALTERSSAWEQKCKLYQDATSQVWDLECLKGKKSF